MHARPHAPRRAAPAAPAPRRALAPRPRAPRASAPPPPHAGGGGTAEPPLTRDALVAYLASGSRPRSEWRIGTEHEKLGYVVADRRRPDAAQIEELLRRIADRFGWERVEEEGRIIALRQDGQSITLEPGGQFELSGATLASLHDTCAEVNTHLYQVR
jgi:glutamate--cysteine ligase